MAATEAQIRANQANAARSTEPKTPEGKEATRANSSKPGMTGAGLVFPQREAAEVQRRYLAFAGELSPAGEVGMALVLRAATMSARMERCAAYETATLSDRVRRLEADFVPPEGVDEVQAAELRAEAGKRALFDPSPEATLARKYEAAAERSFFRALKELRHHEKALEKAQGERLEEKLGSYLPGEMTDEEFDLLEADWKPSTPRKPVERAHPVDFSKPKGRVDVPFSIGRAR